MVNYGRGYILIFGFGLPKGLSKKVKNGWVLVKEKDPHSK